MKRVVECKGTRSRFWTLLITKNEEYGSFCRYMAAGLALVTVKNRMRSEVLAGPAQGTDNFPSILSYGSYLRIPLEVRVDFKSQYSLKSLGLPVETSVHHDW